MWKPWRRRDEATAGPAAEPASAEPFPAGGGWSWSPHPPRHYSTRDYGLRKPDDARPWWAAGYDRGDGQQRGYGDSPDSPEEAMRCFPADAEGAAAKQALLQAAQGDAAHDDNCDGW